MAKAFSVVSWNVEHFGATPRNRTKPRKPIGPIIDYIGSQNADVVGIYEVVGSIVYETITDRMPDYNFFITEGPQAQEILVGVKKTLSSFFTQRLEFKSGQATLRPGALLTIKKDGKSYPLLFLHLKSMTVPKGFGLRDDMTDRALKFRGKLDKIAGGPGKANYIFLGDLNTMGMNITFSQKDISGAEEIARLKRRVKGKKMEILTKSEAETYWPGTNSSYDPSDLDHVVAAKHLKFKNFGGQNVDVRGWTEQSTNAKKDAWTKKFSDHALLYFEVQKA